MQTDATSHNIVGLNNVWCCWPTTRWTSSPRLQGPWVQPSRIPCCWSIGNHSLEDTCRQCASHLVHRKYGLPFLGTCQILHATPQEWWGRSSSQACTHRWWLGRPLWRRVIGYYEGPSTRTAPCTTCVAWWSWDPLWLASHRTSRWAYAWKSWRVFNPRFGAPPEAGRRGQTDVFFRSMVSPRHVFF